MYHYNFTNDLRITSLDEILKEASIAFLTDTVPSSTEDKSKNNNFMTVGFYFNLKAKGNCAKLASKGNTKKVVLNFIKKFQFPNPRTSADYENSVKDKILIAPMRDIVKILHILSLNDRAIAYLTKEEIKNFIFYNDDLAKRNNYNLLITASQIIQYRKDLKLPQNIDTTESKHFWNQPERQIREMIKTLNYTGCFVEDENGIRLKTTGITRDNEADLFEIINYNSYWNGETLEDYQKYMDEISIMEDDMDNQNIKQNQISSYIHNFSQIIYYGVPGSGKSHRIDEETKNLLDEQKMRVVFHPEYTNADFIGQILPVIGGNGVRYAFKAGIFTKILIEALKNPSKPYYLIIEEINRGNAAAIFGEIFQLLDRGDDGWSLYCIMNDDINYEIRKSAPELNWTANTGIRLPPNLSLLATMNTSDQNVFTLDNAFQRRWEMKLVKNNFEGTDAENQRNAKIGESNITWEIFQTHINKKIGEMSSSMGMSSMEDKRLGCWFVKAKKSSEKDKNEKDIFIIDKNVFAEKVLKYLWDDAFKFSREEIFNIKDKTASLESIVSDFKGKDESTSCNWNIFKDTSFISQQDNVQAESDTGETE